MADTGTCPGQKDCIRESTSQRLKGDKDGQKNGRSIRSRNSRKKKQNKSKWRICGVQGKMVQAKYNVSKDIQEGGGVGQAGECKSFSEAAASCGLREKG